MGQPACTVFTGLGVALPVAETVLLTLQGSGHGPTSIASLPTVPTAPPHAVRVRGSVVITTAPGAGTFNIRVRQNNLAGGVLLGLIIPSPAVGSQWFFECIDGGPPVGCTYVVTVQSTTTPGNGQGIAELEEII